MFDRVAILCEAHAESRCRCAPSSYQRYGDRYVAEICAWIPKATYRAIFAAKLREAWRMAKTIAADAAWEASLPSVPDNVLAAAFALRADAYAERITGPGNLLMSLKLSAANAMIETARCGAEVGR